MEISTSRETPSLEIGNHLACLQYQFNVMYPLLYETTYCSSTIPCTCLKEPPCIKSAVVWPSLTPSPYSSHSRPPRTGEKIRAHWLLPSTRGIASVGCIADGLDSLTNFISCVIRSVRDASTGAGRIVYLAAFETPIAVVTLSKYF